VIGADNIWSWLKEARTANPNIKRNVVIKLMSEDRGDVVVEWKLRGAMPIKWTGPTLTAKGGGDVAMEELVLSVEVIEQE
jgi:phage tail-like protein